MNIEKVKNYNQKMLAVFFTMLVVSAAVGLVALVVTLIVELIPAQTTTSNNLITDEKVDNVTNEKLRQQIVSYELPQLIDTLNQIYLIPVGVKTLKKAERKLKQSYSSASENADQGYDYLPSEGFYYGPFNNLIVYDHKSGSSSKVSNDRFIGSDLMFKNFGDEIVVVFTGAERDTDGDKSITLNDFNSLFVYSLKARVLKKIPLDNATVVQYSFIKGSKDILVLFGLDRNKDNRFDPNLEPTFVMKYDYQKSQLVPVVGKKLNEEIQKIVDK